MKIGGQTYFLSQGHVVFAQDKEKRHVALKLVRRDSEESRIMHFLLKAQNERLDKFIPGILPILEILPALARGYATVSTMNYEFDEIQFLTLVRWGDAIICPWFDTVGETLVVIRSLLSALAFLHGSGIVHRVSTSSGYPVSRSTRATFRILQDVTHW